VLHVGIGDSVVASRLADSHLDNISCLRTQHKQDSPVNTCPNNAKTLGLQPAPVRRDVANPTLPGTEGTHTTEPVHSATNYQLTVDGSGRSIGNAPTVRTSRQANLEMSIRLRCDVKVGPFKSTARPTA
jgi:hypothetical protein